MGWGGKVRCNSAAKNDLSVRPSPLILTNSYRRRIKCFVYRDVVMNCKLTDPLDVLEKFIR